jgi:uncharacterized membrane protein YedE/YeeE
MHKSITGLIAGIVFGLGLTISQMVNPDKVLSFLDIFGNWDPSLAFVMGSALAVTALGYRFILKQDKPDFEEKFDLPTNTKIDKELAAGAILFGMGWGLVGLCPGPAIAAISIGGFQSLIFIVAMVSGMALFEIINKQILSKLQSNK